MIVKKLMDGVYYSNAEEETDRPILMFIEGRNKNLLIDSGNSPKHAEEFLNELKKFVNKITVEYVVITHWHWDHTFGMSYFKNSQIIVNKDTNKELEKMQSYKWDDNSLDNRVKEGIEIEFCSEMIKKEYKEKRENIKIIMPDIIFENYLELNLGGITVEIRNTENDHTKDGNIIYIKEKKILFLGDITAPDLYRKNWVYTPTKFVSLMKTIKSYNADIIVESHDKPNSAHDFYKDYEATEIIAQITEKK